MESNGSISKPKCIRKNGNGKPLPSLKLKKTRRGWGAKGLKKKVKHKVLFSVLGNNANGIKAKRESLIDTLNFFNRPSCVLLQKTKLRFPGTFKIKGYQIFEKVRVGMQGLLTAVNHDLQPVLVTSNEEEEAEIQTVQIKVGNQCLRTPGRREPAKDF